MTILVQQQLRAAAREIANWSGALTDTWVSSQASYMWIVGCIDEDDQKYPVVRIEADAYGHQGESEKLAEFFRLANPKAVLALLDEIDRLTVAAKYCEDIDATHENHRETMLYDLAVERDQLKAENARWQQNYEHLIEQHMPRTGHGCEEGWSRVIEARELQASNDQLLDALKDALCALECSPVQYDHVMGKARQAIEKAMGEK